MDPRDSLIGAVIDDYRIEKRLGAGGMAEIYRALDVKLKRYAAIKVIARDFRAQSDYIARFEREAQSIARLEHPNIVRIYRFGESNGISYIAMQYIDGADLSALIRDYKQSGEIMPFSDIVRVVQDISAALDYAHSHDVIHRDVKPSNIMIDQQGKPFLTDFGLALLGDIGTRGEALGSSYYVSPEQVVSSASVVPQSDLYSLGVTLFEMLTGQVPFEGDDALDVTMRQLSETPPAPSAINAGLPQSIDAVVLKALQKDPFDRYTSGAEMSAALAKAVAEWDGSAESGSGARRPSLVLLPHKVREQLQSSPLPAIDTAPLPTRPAPANEIPTESRFRTADEAKQQGTFQEGRGNRWRGALIFALILFLIGAGLLVMARLVAVNSAEGERELVLELTVTSAAQAAEVTLSPVIVIITATQVPAFDSVPPTTLPVVIVLPTDSPLLPSSTLVPPTLTPIPPTDTPPPPTLTPVPPTSTEIPTLPPVPTTAPPATIMPYQLIIFRVREDGIIVMNVSSAPFPLAPLRLGDRGAVSGSEWGVDVLGANQCVVAWRDGRGAPRIQDVNCQVVGETVQRRGRERFWRDDFDVYYYEALVTECDDDSCSITIPQVAAG